jgi:hypothetical protein
MNCFVICPQCSRHVRNVEPTCPFCDGALAGAQCRAPSNWTSPRALLFAAAAASVGAACSSHAVPMYGHADFDAGTGTGGLSAGGSNTGGVAGNGGSGGAQPDASSDGAAPADAGDASAPPDATGD